MPKKPVKPVEPIYFAVGAKMVMMRDAIGMTQAELAKRIGLARASVANIETGRQRILLSDLEKISSSLGSTPKHFLRGIWL